MPNQQLISYIQEQLRKGYDINSIKTYLLKYGYKQADVSDAIKHVYAPKKKKANKTVLIIFAAVIGILLIVMAVMILYKPAKEEVTLSIQSELLSKQIIPGGYIYFKTEMTKSPGSISLEYRLVGPDGKILERAEEESVKTKTTKQFRLPSESLSGTYTITTTAEQGEMTDSSSFTFAVAKIGEEIITPEPIDPVVGQCPSSCDDTDKCTQDYCSENTGYLCMHDRIIPCCGNNRCETGESSDTCSADCKEVGVDEFESLTIWERVDAIKEMAKTSPIKARDQCDLIGVASHRDQCYYNIAEVSGAIDYCELITDDKIKDRCLTKIAEITKNTNICISISTESRRDNCYMNFVQAGDYTICDKLVNKYYKESCNALSVMADIPDYSNYEVPEFT